MLARGCQDGSRLTHWGNAVMIIDVVFNSWDNPVSIVTQAWDVGQTDSVTRIVIVFGAVTEALAEVSHHR